MADLLVVPRPAVSLQDRAEKLEQTKPTVKGGVASVPQNEQLRTP